MTRSSGPGVRLGGARPLAARSRTDADGRGRARRCATRPAQRVCETIGEPYSLRYIEGAHEVFDGFPEQGYCVGVEASECQICMAELADRETIDLACKHTFHKDCLAEWAKRSKTCPGCKREFGDGRVDPEWTRDVDEWTDLGAGDWAGAGAAAAGGGAAEAAEAAWAAEAAAEAEAEAAMEAAIEAAGGAAAVRAMADAAAIANRHADVMQIGETYGLGPTPDAVVRSGNIALMDDVFLGARQNDNYEMFHYFVARGGNPVDYGITAANFSDHAPAQMARRRRRTPKRRRRTPTRR